MRSSLKRTAAVSLAITAGTLAWAGAAGATCIPGTKVCATEVAKPDLPGAPDPFSRDASGPADRALGKVQNPLDSVQVEKLEQLQQSAGGAVSDAGDAAQGLAGGVHPIPPLPPGIRPVADRVGGAVSDAGDAAQGLAGGVHPIPPLPPGIKPVVDKVLGQLP